MGSAAKNPKKSDIFTCAMNASSGFITTIVMPEGTRSFHIRSNTKTANERSALSKGAVNVEPKNETSRAPNEKKKEASARSPTIRESNPRFNFLNSEKKYTLV